MSSWPVQNAKARFSELLDVAIKEGPQVVTRRGEEVVVVVPMAEWRRVSMQARPTLKDLLLAPGPTFDLDPFLPVRGRHKRREPVEFE